ncbi:uncharacterized protein [Drosophila pseudoobscura]|uniref:Ima1 N-terminal domain-containing protein n=1 Tax=Drosophila pseudoobscura pseudoobscura TaxID=46245 RepID=A0A6I8W3G2_DROPS|nr:uncharacterized protein LOC6901600 [Drosophila pseudoobscura]XP_033237843.1 uncharacterized protein LOC6901600 [Drosophila pseudoobscura]
MLKLVLMITFPVLGILLVIRVIVKRLYENIRPRFDATVNCWFCNENARVRYVERNRWTCPKCEQYNGFTKDGDYNRDMSLQRDTSAASSQKNTSTQESNICANSYYPGAIPSSAMNQSLNNGLCGQCNESQRLKIEKLAQFEPKNESRFDQELKVYKEQLEHQFRLCSSCERHVNKVLHEKKKMILSSKILNFLIKGAAVLKEPHFNRLASAQRQQRLQRYQLWMAILTAGNILCLLCSLPPATREQFHAFLGKHLGTTLFYLYSHVVALLRVTSAALGDMLEQRAVVARTKLLLYARTFGKLLLYSGGLSQQQLQQATFSSCFIGLYPYAMLALSFFHKVSNGLRLTRFTLILLMWSVCAMGTALLQPYIDGISFNLLGSVITLILLATNRANLLSQRSQDESASESFHRLCTDECITDEETFGMITEQLSTCSARSIGSPSSGITSLQQQTFLDNGSVRNLSRISPHSGITSLRQRGLAKRHGKSPTGLSMESLHLSSRQGPSTVYSAPTWRPAPDPASPAAPTWNEPLQSTATDWYRHANLNGHTMHQMNGRSTQNLLMPSRLPVPQTERDVGAWVVTHSINPNAYDQCPKESQQKEQLQQQQQLSRTSSQSSGFESQTRPESQWNPTPTAGNPFQFYAPSAAPSPGFSFAGPPAWDYPGQRTRREGVTLQPGDLLRNWVEGKGRAQLH